MKKHNILVTAVGAVVGYGIIEALRKSRYAPRIIGTDIFSDAVGQFFADDFVIATPAAADAYPSFLRRTIERFDIDLVLFGIEQEIDAVMRHRDELQDLLPKLLLPSPAVYRITQDKWETMRWLTNNGLSEYAIDSVIEGDFQEISSAFGLPFLIKPRVSRAGKGIAAIHHEIDFAYHKSKLEQNFMAQRIVGSPDAEYTVGVFSTGDGRVCADITLRRTLSGEGATAKAWVVDDPDISRATKRVTEALCPTGPVNYQFRKEDGRVYLLEINPRISSSTSIRSSFGYNEAEMCIDFFLEHKEPSQPLLANGYALRYIKDWVVKT